MSSPFQNLRLAVQAADAFPTGTVVEIARDRWHAILDAASVVDAEPALLEAELADLRAQLARSEARQAKLERRFASIVTIASGEGLVGCDVHGTPLEHYVDRHCPACTREGGS